MNKQKRADLKRNVIQAYKDKYPSWNNIEVTEIIEDRVLNTMVSVKSDKSKDGEICVYRNGEVTIFDTTPELIRHIANRASLIVTFKDFMVAFIVLAMLTIFAGIVFIQQDQNSYAMVTTAVSGILGTFVGVKVRK